MTGQERDYDAVLSRVLHSTTDQVEPVGDGLTKIQARLAEPWLKRQWWLLRGEFTILGWVLAVRCQSWFSTIRSGSAAGADTGDEAGTAGAGAAGDGGRLRSLPVLGGVAAWASGGRLRSLPVPASIAAWASGGRLRSLPVLGGVAAWASGKRARKPVGPAMAWLRPALAVAGAVVLVVAGVFAMTQIQRTVVGLEGDNPSSISGSTQGGGPGGTNGSGGQAISGGPSATQGGATSAKHGSSPSSKQSPSPAACSSPGGPSPSPSPSPTAASPSASPTPTTPTPTPTTPSPSPTTSTGSLIGGQTAGSQTQAIGTTALVVCQHTAPKPQPSPTSQATTGV